MLVPHPRCTFQGSYVALVTPFKDGEIDYAAFRNLIEWHIASKTDGLVVAGTTGEAATLTDAERIELIRAALAATRGRIPMIAGVGTNSTRTTVETARRAADAGADGLLVVTPYYNKPSRRGLVLHFSAVAEAVSKPIVLYNVPSRTGVDMAPEVSKELGERYSHIVAVKEALPSPERVKRLVSETPLGVLCGEDAAIVDFIHQGALGVISVVNNIVPEQISELVRAAIAGKDTNSVKSKSHNARTAALVEQVAPLVRDLFIESNPVPAKAALSLMGRCRDEVRLPLASLEPANLARLQATLRTCGLI